MILRDGVNREISLHTYPGRIISLVPSQTELLVDLGLESQLVGVTKFCVHPSYIRKSKKVVGGTKKVHLEKIKSLQPDIILCNKEENTLEMVKELEKIAPVHVSNIMDFQDVLNLIKDYGSMFGKNFEATQLIQQLQDKKNNFQKEIRIKNLKVAYFIWREPWMLAGRDTFINTLLELNGFENVIEDKNSRYPEIILEELAGLKPDVVLLSSEPFPFKKKHLEEIKEHCNKSNILLADGEYFSWYGTRLLPAFNYFKELQIILSSSL